MARLTAFQFEFRLADRGALIAGTDLAVIEGQFDVPVGIAKKISAAPDLSGENGPQFRHQAFIFQKDRQAGRLQGNPFRMVAADLAFPFAAGPGSGLEDADGLHRLNAPPADMADAQNQLCFLQMTFGGVEIDRRLQPRHRTGLFQAGHQGVAAQLP